jgi:hypothetical protein
MNAAYTKPSPAASAGQRDKWQERPRLAGGWLALARALWIFYFIRVLANFAYQPSFAFQQFSDPAIVGSIGMPLDLYAWITVSLAVLALVFASVVAVILFWRRSDNWMALVASLFLLGWANNSLSGAAQGGSLPHVVILPFWVQELIVAPFGAALYAFVLLFPSGRFVPRWSWALLVMAAFAIFLANGGDDFTWLFPLFLVTLLVAIGRQVYRYRRVSTPTERQQTKWVVIGLALFVLSWQLFWTPSSFTPLGQTLWYPVTWLLYLLAALFPPVSFFLAIQRYGLFEIDRIINRALVYGLLTGILGAVFVGGVIGLQHLFHATTGQDSLVAIIASTLVIAGLSQPLLSFLQQSIDRRFYRAKYDARKTLSAFNATLRQEMSLAELQAQVIAAVNQTMQPAHISLWPAEPQAKASLYDSPAPAHSLPKGSQT